MILDPLLLLPEEQQEDDAAVLLLGYLILTGLEEDLNRRRIRIGPPALLPELLTLDTQKERVN